MKKSVRGRKKNTKTSGYVPSIRPVCDAECRRANRCEGRMASCKGCHKSFCESELYEGYCPSCSDRRTTCDYCGEMFDIEDGVENSRGKMFCSCECEDVYAHEHYETIMCDVCGIEQPSEKVHYGCCESCLRKM